MARARLILGSGSPRRLTLLKQLNIKPDIVDSPNIIEIPASGEKPRDYVRRLAIEKNQALHTKYAQDYILTGDTTVALGRRFIEKAEDAAEQKKFMRLMSGRAHHVISAICLKFPDNSMITKISTTRVILKRLSDQDIQNYVDSNDWKGKAGYGVQGIEHLIKSIHGSYSGILGLPLYETHQLLLGSGYLRQ